MKLSNLAVLAIILVASPAPAAEPKINTGEGFYALCQGNAYTVCAVYFYGLLDGIGASCPDRQRAYQGFLNSLKSAKNKPTASLLREYLKNGCK